MSKELRMAAAVVAGFAGIVAVSVVSICLMAVLAVPFPGRYQVIRLGSESEYVRIDTWTGKSHSGEYDMWMPIEEWIKPTPAAP